MTLLDRAWTEPLPIHAWLVEHPEGPILIDTGETARVAESGYFPAWHPYFRFGVRSWVKPEEEIGPAVKALGIEPDEVRRVVMTHLHTDHAGGLSHFPKSEILISRVEFENASGPMGKARGFLPNRWPEWLDPTLFEFGAEAVGPFPRSRAVTAAGDVVVVPTPGHTKGHVSVVLDEGERSVFFAGDTSYTQGLMVEGAVDGVAPDGDGARETLRRIQKYAEQRPLVYLPSHDPDAKSRLEGRDTVPTDALAGSVLQVGRS